MKETGEKEFFGEKTVADFAKELLKDEFNEVTKPSCARFGHTTTHKSLGAHLEYLN